MLNITRPIFKGFSNSNGRDGHSRFVDDLNLESESATGEQNEELGLRIRIEYCAMIRRSRFFRVELSISEAEGQVVHRVCLT